MSRNAFFPPSWPILALASLMLLAGCGGGTPVADPSTERAIAQGRLVGAVLEDGKVHAWKGIPFAQPPVESLRWRAPEPPAAWEGLREALVSGSACPQLGGDPVLGSEDCLYLDVYAPPMTSDAIPQGADRLPVMYWIHGGGNSMGSGDQLPPQALARDNGVIVVTINYRLGVFGWLSHEALRESAAGPDDASGNFGTLDIIRGLEWVQQNIATFGGDPNRVTIFGESAGGMNVFSLLLSPRAQGLFHAAIAQSGIPTSLTRDESEHYTDDPDAPGLPGSSGELVIALLQQAGRATDRDSAKALVAEMDATEVEGFLRGFSTEEILAPFAKLMEEAGLPIYMSPNILQDGTVIREGEPLELLGTKGAYTAVPFMAGTNREESKLFFAMGSPHVSRTFGMPTGIRNERLYDVEGEYGGLLWRALGADEPLSAMRRVQGPSVWGYRFDWDEEPVVMGLDLSKLLGAAHAIELFFVFGLQDLGFGNRFLYEDVESAAILSARMRSYWANFAHTFRPGTGQGEDLPEWQPWGAASRDPKYMVFDTEQGRGLRMEADRIDQGRVFARVAKDPRLLSDEERCGVYRNFVQWSDSLSVEAYNTLEDGLCTRWPLESRLFFPSLSAPLERPAESAGAEAEAA